MMLQELALHAIRDMILRMVNAFTLIQTMPSHQILAADYGIGMNRCVLNAQTIGFSTTTKSVFQ
jgi:hypothetical protein